MIRIIALKNKKRQSIQKKGAVDFFKQILCQFGYRTNIRKITIKSIYLHLLHFEWRRELQNFQVFEFDAGQDYLLLAWQNLYRLNPFIFVRLFQLEARFLKVSTILDNILFVYFYNKFGIALFIITEGDKSVSPFFK